MKIDILVIEPQKKPYVKKVERDDLETLQDIVGGYLEYIPLVIDGIRYLVFCNEEGLIHNLPPNRVISGTLLYGNVFITRFDGISEIEGLTDIDIKRLTPYL